MAKVDTPLRLTAHGLSLKDLAVLRSLLALYRGRLTRECRLCDDPAHADLHLIDIDTSNGQAAWEALRNKSQCVVYSHSAVEVPLLLRKPLHGPTLLAVLSEVVSHPGVDTTATRLRPPVPSGLELAEPVVPRAGTLIELLENGAIDTSVRITIPSQDEAPDHPENLWIDPDLKQYLLGSSLGHLRSFLRSVLEPRQIQRASRDEYRAQAQRVRPKTLTRLQWFSALSCSDGELLPSFDRSRPFQLTAWPDMEGHSPFFFRLAGLLVKQAVTFDEVIAMTGIESAVAADFVNASYRCGLTRQVARRAGSIHGFPFAGRNIVSRLRQRLGL